MARRRPIRAVSVRQPYALAIAHLGQDVENRPWPVPQWLFGGYLAIHAPATVEAEALLWLRDAIRFQTEPQLYLPLDFDVDGHLTTSAVVAVAVVRGCVAVDQTEALMGARGQALPVASRFGDVPDGWSSPWLCGPFGWVLSDVVALPTPVPCKGARNLWELPPDVLAAVRAEFGRAAA